MTSNFGKEFHRDYTGMLGMTGRTLIQRNMETFDVNPLIKYNRLLENLQQDKRK